MVETVVWSVCGIGWRCMRYRVAWVSSGCEIVGPAWRLLTMHNAYTHTGRLGCSARLRGTSRAVGDRWLRFCSWFIQFKNVTHCFYHAATHNSYNWILGSCMKSSWCIWFRHSVYKLSLKALWRYWPENKCSHSLFSFILWLSFENYLKHLM